MCLVTKFLIDFGECNSVKGETRRQFETNFDDVGFRIHLTSGEKMDHVICTSTVFS